MKSEGENASQHAPGHNKGEGTGASDQAPGHQKTNDDEGGESEGQGKGKK